MRLNLSSDATQYLTRVHDRIKAINPHIDTPNARFISKLLAAMEEALTDDQLKGMASQMTALPVKKKILRDEFAAYGDELDSEEERESMRKHYLKIVLKRSKLSKNNGESAEHP